MILVFRHGATISPGYLGELMAGLGVPVETVPLYAGARPPDHLEFSGVVSLGGVMGAYDGDRYPWLEEEKRYLRAAVAAGIPVLGVCLGCQLLADALGGRVYRAPTTEIGVLSVQLTDAGSRHPVVSQLDRPTLVWHQDTWEAPPGAELLAATDEYPHAFALGSALGVQSHPETTPEMLKEWIEGEGPAYFDRIGVDPDGLLAELEARRHDTESMAHRLFGAWLAGIGFR